MEISRLLKGGMGLLQETSSSVTYSGIQVSASGSRLGRAQDERLHRQHFLTASKGSPLSQPSKSSGSDCALLQLPGTRCAWRALPDLCREAQVGWAARCAGRCVRSSAVVEVERTTASPQTACLLPADGWLAAITRGLVGGEAASNTGGDLEEPGGLLPPPEL